MSVLSESYAWNASEEVAQICSPLFDDLGFNYFSYSVSYPDQSSIALASNRAWYEYFMNTKHPFTASRFETGLFFWDDICATRLNEEAARLFDLNNGIAMVKQFSDRCEVVSFMVPSNFKGGLGFYFNHLDLLEKFRFFFKETAASIIEKAEKQRLVLEQNKLIDIQKQFSAIALSDFAKHIQLKGYHIEGYNGLRKLSLKEITCMLLCANGYSAKHIAKKLFLSDRTVETHLHNVRHKLGCYNKKQLKTIISEHHLQHLCFDTNDI